jgi:hypothetical protein
MQNTELERKCRVTYFEVPSYRLHGGLRKTTNKTAGVSTKNLPDAGLKRYR